MLLFCAVPVCQLVFLIMVFRVLGVLNNLCKIRLRPLKADNAFRNIAMIVNTGLNRQ